MDELAKVARIKKAAFLTARANLASHETLKVLADEYCDAIAAWHKVRYPGKKFKRPSLGYLIRAM